MGKIIIENRTELPDVDVLMYVEAVMRDGRISNNGTQYCYASVFRNSNIVVVTDLNKRSDRFIVSVDKTDAQ